jgi:hypothetical protein
MSTQEEILKELKQMKTQNRGRNQLLGCLFFLLLIIFAPCFLGLFAVVVPSP